MYGDLKLPEKDGTIDLRAFERVEEKRKIISEMGGLRQEDKPQGGVARLQLGHADRRTIEVQMMA